MKKPIVYFAFANQGEDYLNALNDEIRGIKPLFIDSHLKEELVFAIDENAGLNEMAASFTALNRKNTKENPKIIHFSGHADKAYWLLANNQDVNANSLSNLLDGIENVALVFMNACCTKDLKDFLLDEIGVKAVIATSKKISDKKAALFATKFYERWLDEKTPLLQAFNNICAADGIMFQTYDGDNYRGIVRDEEQEEGFAWGLYWKDEKAKDIILNDGSINRKENKADEKEDPAKNNLLEEYELAQKLVYEKAFDLDKVNKELQPFSLMPDTAVPDMFKGLVTLAKDNKEKTLQAYQKLKQNADTLWQQILNYDRTPSFKEAFNTFNFTKELGGLTPLVQEQGKGVRNGVYLLRGTSQCGLGLLSYRIMALGRPPIAYDFMPACFDFEGRSEENNILENIKKQLFSPKENLTILSFEDLAKAIQKTYLEQTDPKPFVLVLNNAYRAFRGNDDALNIFFDKFWRTLQTDIKDKTNIRQIIILFLENTDDPDYVFPEDTEEEEEEDITFCGISYTPTHKANNVFPVKKIAKLKKDEISDWCVNKPVFFDWLNRLDDFWVDNKPFVGTTLVHVAKKINNAELINYIESRNNFRPK